MKSQTEPLTYGIPFVTFEFMEYFNKNVLLNFELKKIKKENLIHKQEPKSDLRADLKDLWVQKRIPTKIDIRGQNMMLRYPKTGFG